MTGIERTRNVAMRFGAASSQSSAEASDPSGETEERS
jgi:hypothetical protein